VLPLARRVLRGLDEGTITADTLAMSEDSLVAWEKVPCLFPEMFQPKEPKDPPVDKTVIATPQTSAYDAAFQACGGNTQTSAYGSVERRLKWVYFQFFVGSICIIAGLGFSFFDEASQWILGIALIAFGIQAFFVSFLIDAFTDIRWFL
jgi:hypothetical protein